MGDGTKENPYTREDVLRLIEENGGETEGLNLSGNYFIRMINLSKINLKGVYLWNSYLEGADLSGAHCEGAYLYGAHLERASLVQAHLEGAYLFTAYLEGAHLFDTNFEGADLSGAHLEGAILNGACLEMASLMGANLERAYLYHANVNEANLIGAHLSGACLKDVVFPYNTKLAGADWGNYILGDEGKGQYKDVADTYRQLKIWYTQHGIYDVAGKFFYREMEAKRKGRSWKKEPHLKLWGWILRLLCGYGEKPERVVISAAIVILGLAAAYYFWGSFSSSSFLSTLYYSVVSFVALGYGSWVSEPIGWARYIGAVEAVTGVFMMALFLVTFTRKMTR